MLLTQAVQDPGGQLANNLRDLGLGSLLDDTEMETIGGQQRLKNPFEIRALGLNFDREGSLRQKLRQSGFISEVDGVERIMGIAVGDEDSVSFLEYGRTGQRLTENQIAALKSLMGNEIIQGSIVAKNIAESVDMAEKIAKLTKRHKSFSSPRQVSIAGRGLADFLGIASNQPFDEGMFASSIHLFQPQAELLAARFNINDAIVSNVLQGPRFYDGVDLNEEARSLIDYAMGGINPGEEATLRTLVEQAFSSTASGGSVVGTFESLVKDEVINGNISSQGAKRIENALKQMEISVDGEFVMNRANMEQNIRGWAETVNNVKEDMRTGGIDSISPERYQDYLDAQMMLSTVAEDTGTIRRGGGRIDTRYEMRSDIDKIGFSGRVMYHDPDSGEKRFIKGRMRIRDLPSNISIATPDIMIKKEAGMEEFINFDIVSGSGPKPRATAPDIQTILFHRDEFFDVTGQQVSLPQATLSYGEGLVDELREIQMTGIIPGKAKQRMLQDLEESGISRFMRTFEPHKVASKEKNREMVRRLNDAILTGNLTDPEVISHLSNYYRNELYDQKTSRILTDMGRTGMGTLRIPKTPDYMAFDVAAETAAMQFDESPRLLSGNVRRGSLTGTADRFSQVLLPDDPTTSVNAIELPMARVHKGMLLMSGSAASEGHYQLGGFDFDDKGLPALRSIRERDGHMRVVSFTTRQPTGPKEYIVQDLLKDQGTLQNLFGKNENFMKNLREMSQDSSLDSNDLKSIRDVLFYMETDPSTLTDSSEIARFANLQRKYAGLALSNQEVRLGQLMGTRSSQLLDRDDPFFIAGQREVDTVIASVYQRVTGQGVKEISEGVMRAMRRSGRSGVLALTPEAMKQMAPADRMDFLPAYYEGQFFKLIMEAKPSEIPQANRDDIIAALNGVGGVPATMISALTNATDDTSFRSALQAILNKGFMDSLSPNDQQRIRAAILSGLQGYVSSVQLPEQGEIIGSYINRLMSVASTEGQRTAIASRLQELEDAGNAQAGALRQLLEGIYSGFIPPSDAVDAAVNAGGQIIKGIEPGAGRDAYIQGLTSALSMFDPDLATDPLRQAEFTEQINAFLTMLHGMPEYDDQGRLIRSFESSTRCDDDQSWKINRSK